MSDRAIVVKVGGSLLNARNLVPRLQGWLRSQSRRCVLIAGGGPEVKTLRAGGECGEEDAHWVCIDVMRKNTANLCRQYPAGRLVEGWADAETGWQRGEQPFLDLGLFLHADKSLPHSWDVSSDSIAARVAAVHGAEVVLLKSCRLDQGPYNWERLAQLGVVDAWFPLVALNVANITLANLPE
jgi:5-(aminomethyl)-3-furanmethanol phosphate kinase